MSEIFDLDDLDNGEPGALGRMTAGLAAAGLRFEVLRHHAETHRPRISGTIRDIDAYRADVATSSEWVEGCLDLPRTILSGRHGLPWLPDQDRFVIGDALNKLKERTRFPEDPRALDLSSARRLDAAIFLGGRGGATYGHWLLDFVPQILTALEVTRRLESDAPFVVVNYTPFGKRLLKFLGLHHRCVFTERDETVVTDRLFMPLITKLGHRYSIEVLRQSFAHMLALTETAAGPATKAGPRKILIGRRRAPFCTNFAEVQAALEPRGFRVLYPEDHNYRMQFQLFHQAEIVVGEDGSAMHNAGFCRPGTPLIVFSRADKVNWWHGPVAQAADLPLHYLQSRLSPGGDSYEAPVDEILKLV